MTPLFFYFLKQLAIAGLCFAYYGLVLRNKAQHQRSRWFLAASVVASILLPLVPVYWPWAQESGAGIPLAMQAITLPVVQIGGQQSEAATPFLRFETLYAGIALLLLLRVGYNCWRIRRLQSRSQLTKTGDVVMARSANVGLPFSFFNVIFWNASMQANSNTGTQILQHEMVHVRQRHSVDKLLLELVCACCWINPFFYLYRREMALVHEFLADEGAAQDKAQYAETILHAAFQPAWALTNSFFHPPIQRRIQMLFSKPTKFSLMNKLALLPLGLALAAVIVCQAQNDTKHGKQTASTKLTGGNLDQVVVVGYSNDVISKTADENAAQNQDGKVYTTVQNPPTYPGGQEALVKFLSQNIRYPSAAHKEHRMGTVMIQFIVAADGHITGAKTVGASHGDLDQEALRVVNMMPTWTPGTQDGKRVAVQFNLPVHFVLEDGATAYNQQQQLHFTSLRWTREGVVIRSGC